MIVVEILIEGDINHLRIWASPKVFKYIEKYEQRNRDHEIENDAIKKLQHLTDVGLQIDTVNIKYEWDSVHRIKLPKNGRIIGFYDSGDFIGINCFNKGRQELNKDQRKIINSVATIKSTGDWKRG